MKEIKVFNLGFEDSFKDQLTQLILNFDGINGGEGRRNIIKTKTLQEISLNIKAFKMPMLVNQIVYNFFRKSKAQRSFEYAKILIDLNVGTPLPIAYYEFRNSFLFKKSYYVSAQQSCDLTYRELSTNLDFKNHEKILRAFTRFTFDLHQKGILFLDHSPGNTLIEINNGDYKFYLVDLNRMKFKSLDFKARIKNFSRLTTHQSLVEIMSDEYAKCIQKDYESVFHLMWKETQAFQRKFQRKKKFKKTLKFWKRT